MSNPLRRQPPAVTPDYDWSRDGQPTRELYGNYLVKPSVQVIIRKPSWEGTETVFRPFPSLSYTNPEEFEPYRLDPGGSARFGNWIRRYDCAWNVGVGQSITFLTHNPASRDTSYDPAATPLGVLYNAINDAIRAEREQPGFGALLKGGSGRGAPLTRVKSCYLIQGVLYVHKSELQYGPGKPPPGLGDRPCILTMSGGCGAKLARLLDEENTEFTGDPGDFEARYKAGDPVSPQTGRFLHLFESGSNPQERYKAKPQARSGPAWKQPRLGTGGDLEVKGYDVLFSRELPDGIRAEMSEPEDLDIIRRQWLYWEDVLFFPTPLEQAHLLNRVFPAHAIIYAFEGVDPEWITEETWRRYRATMQASVPAAPPGPGTPGARGGRSWLPVPGTAMAPPPEQLPPGRFRTAPALPPLPSEEEYTEVAPEELANFPEDPSYSGSLEDHPQLQGQSRPYRAGQPLHQDPDSTVFAPPRAPATPPRRGAVDAVVPPANGLADEPEQSEEVPPPTPEPTPQSVPDHAADTARKMAGRRRRS